MDMHQWRPFAARGTRRFRQLSRVRARASLAVLVLTLLLAGSAEARREYARATGKACAVCHQSASGGGELRSVGHAFVDNERSWPAAESAWWALEDGRRSAVRFLGGLMHLLVVCGWLIALVAQSAPLRDRVPRALAATAWRLDPWLLAVAVVTGGVATMLRIGDLRLMTGTTYGLMMLAKAVPAGGLVIADLVLGGARESWHRRPAVRGGVAVVALVATVVSWIVG